MTRGLRQFLDSLGALTPKERARAARTTATAWARELACGEGQDLNAIIKPMRAGRKRPDVVWIADLEFASICPHHLLPSRGVAHVAYAPDRLLAPLGHISTLVQVASARLIMQEDLGEMIVDAVHAALAPHGSACMIEGTHDCMQLRGARARNAKVSVLATRGTLDTAASRRELLRYWRSGGQ